MGQLTGQRYGLLGFIDGSEILEYVKNLGIQKKIDFPGIDSYIADYRQNEAKLLQQVYSGVKTKLPPSGLFSMDLMKLRTLDSKTPLIESLEAVLSFDENNQVFVNYLINGQDSLASWAKKHPELNEQNLKNHLDSYFLEHFEEQHLTMQDSKLYDAAQGKLITYQDYLNLPAGQQKHRVEDKLKSSGWIKKAKLSYDSPQVSAENLDQMLP
jgi:hypothetical protein